MVSTRLKWFLSSKKEPSTTSFTAAAEAVKSQRQENEGNSSSPPTTHIAERVVRYQRNAIELFCLVVLLDAPVRLIRLSIHNLLLSSSLELHSIMPFIRSNCSATHRLSSITMDHVVGEELVRLVTTRWRRWTPPKPIYMSVNICNVSVVSCIYYIHYFDRAENFGYVSMAAALLCISGSIAGVADNLPLLEK